MPARWWILALVAAGAFVAGGCAQLEGDFGRPKRSFWREDVAPIVGGAAAKLRGEPVSLLARTDDERELRDLAYAFLTPPEGFRPLSVAVGEMRAARLLPNLPAVPNPDAYAQLLLSYHYRSTTARWQRLMDDIRSDRQRVGPFVRVAVRVVEIDAVRRKAMEHASSLTPEQRADAVARMEENASLISDVCRALGERMATYRHAMEVLVVAQPAPIAVEAERALTGLRDTAGGLSCGSFDLVARAAQPGHTDEPIVRTD